MSGPHSGRQGVVNGVSTVRNWTVNELQDLKTFVASNTQSGTGRQRGAYDWNGNFSIYGPGLLALMPGNAFSFSGFTAPDDDSEGGVGTKYDGTAIVDSLAVTWNWASQDIISAVCNFSGNGALTSTDAATALTDSTTPTVNEVCPAKVEYSVNGTDWLDWDNITQASVTFTTANQQYLNSSSIDSGKCWVKRKKGVLDWTGSLTEEETTRDNGPNPGDDIGLRLYVDASTFFSFMTARVGDFSNITVDREGGSIITRQPNLAMNAWDTINDQIGAILMPGGTQYWPFS